MAEDPSLHPSSDTSPLSNKRRIDPTLSPQDPFPTIDAVLDEPQETQASPEQSPKKAKPNSLDCPLVDSPLEFGFSKEKFILDGDSEVSGVFGEVSEGSIENTGTPMSLDDANEVSGVVLGGKIEPMSLGDANEVSRVVLGDKIEALGGVDVANEVSEKSFNLEGNHDVNSESFGLVLQKSDEGFSGIQKGSADMVDEISKKMVEFDSNKVVHGIELEKGVEGFDRKGEIDEFLELKNEVSVMGRENSSEIVQLGSSESQSDGNTDAAPLCSKSNKNKTLENDDIPACSLNVQLIDETAVVNVVVNGGKRSRRKGSKGGLIDGGVAESSNGAKGKMAYSRKEMEKLRYVNVKAQKKFWQEVYNGLAGNVKKEYSVLGNFKHKKQGGSNYDYNNQAAGKKSYTDQGILGDLSSGNVSCDAEMLSSPNASVSGENLGKDGNDLEWSEDEESDDEYHSIQRPAFMVQGDPDFESGPPEDGLEYLRRVRWEAAQIPKVKVVSLDRGKLKEQSVYMPKIPDIEKCPPHLAPLSDWENEFMAEFTELRLAISSLDDTNDAASDDSQTIVFGHPGPTKHNSKSLSSLELPAGNPTLSTILDMDPVTRVALLRKCISLFENASILSKDDCAWLFALCAVVDTPLDADTSVSLRCLLRRCAKLRAEKPELDDEVVMLNVLATIAGKYFGQSEN